MDNLPKAQVQDNEPTVISGGDKERAEGGIEPLGLREVGREAPLAPEVGAAGVKLHPTTVPIPKPVAKLGVQPVGQAATVQQTPAVALPLSDDQIARGLHESITSSWRWLAQWCIRKLKQLHMAIKKVHGRFVRVKI